MPNKKNKVTNREASSLSQCASLCLNQIPICLTIGYHRARQSCDLYKDLLSASNFYNSLPYLDMKYYATANPCPGGFSYLAKHKSCLEIVNYGLLKIDSYTTAKSKCFERGAHLFYFDDEELKLDFFNFMLNKDRSFDQFFVGGDSKHDPRSGRYKWLDGRDVGNITWGSDEPQILKDCLTIKRDENAYYLTSVYCYEKHHYICEMKMGFTTEPTEIL
ncbi:hypothetical protein LOTGIDRAFT_153595 [Lottia gigantea]|uniref:C-type lectin domain-containing protein n=1 Tax=Lottia gigantea TaxID=225164 RepID=V4BQJ5_LOTGI|nr:hypothetical protein LOTGIDRAFT_153595 [Lottia gigantea]ESO91164.1 hypothetical protein LOTGIDRAFT_153595 [Lottia gigantea]